jgi:hypothetical protein
MSEQLFGGPQVDLDDTLDCVAHADRNILQPATTHAGQLHERAPVVRRFLKQLGHSAHALIEILCHIISEFLLHTGDLP